MNINIKKLYLTKTYVILVILGVLQATSLQLQAQNACFQWVRWSTLPSAITFPVGLTPVNVKPWEGYKTSSTKTVSGKLGDTLTDNVNYTSTENIMYRTGLHVTDYYSATVPRLKFYNFYLPDPMTNFIANELATSNTLQFTDPKPNPILVFESVGSGDTNAGTPVSVIFKTVPGEPEINLEIISAKRVIGDLKTGPSKLQDCDQNNTITKSLTDVTNAITADPVDGIATTYGNLFLGSASTATCLIKVVDNGRVVGFIAQEAFVAVKAMGEYTTIKFDYSKESYVQFVFGYDPSICGNGHLECGEACDLGGLGPQCVDPVTCVGHNGDPDAPGLACSSQTCKAMEGSECSGMNNLESWMSNFDDLIADVVTSDPGCLVTNDCTSTVLTEEQIENLRGQSNYLVAYHPECTGSGLDGEYEKLILTSSDTNVTKEIIFRCTKDKIRMFDRQVLSKEKVRNYATATGGCTGAGSVAISDLLLDGEIKTCQLYCDDNSDCKHVVETIDLNGNKKCQLYSTCVSGGAGTTYHLSL